MVSLSDNSRHSGGYFFNDEQPTVQTTETDELLTRDHVQFTGDIDLPFRKIKTTWIIVLEILLFVTVAAGAFVIPFVCIDKKCGADAVAIVIYTYGGLWCIVLLLDRFYRQQHYVNRLNGYLDFYRSTKNIRRVPFIAKSGGNTILLVVTKVLEEYCSGSHTCEKLQKERYIQIVICVELAVILPFLILYLVRTVRFNQKQAYPDVSQDEMLTSFIHSQSQTSDVGFRDDTYVDQVLEKQADMIRYLKQHNMQLGKRILALTSEVNTLKGDT